MKARPVTAAQREILVALHLGWRFGGDDRSLRGLRTRGLIEMVRHTIPDPAFGRTILLDLPHLTPAGRLEAARLWLQVPLEQKRQARAEIASIWGRAA